MESASKTLTNIELLPPQRDFLENNNTYSLFSGGFGSGKTVALVLKALLISQAMPGNFGLIGRLTYPELRDTTQKTFFEFCPPDWYSESRGGVWNKSENYIRLYNGSEIIFRHLDNISERELLSLNLGWFGIDQAEETSESVFQILQSRLRNNKIPRRYGFLICNPAGHNWLWHRFHPESKERMNDGYYVESTTYDNKANLPQDYITHMEESYTEEMVKRYLYGSWDVFEGQVFTEFDKKIHVIDPFDIPQHWERLVSIDHGLVNPTAVLWGAIDQDGNIFIYDEHYQAGRPISYHAAEIKKKTGKQQISLMIIDPSTVAKTREKDGFPYSIIQEYNDCKLYPVPGNNDVSASINRIKEFLKVQPKRFHPTNGKVGSPRLFIFRNCENMISEISKYHWKKLRSLNPQNPLEQTSDIDDHTVDALRYMVMARWPSAPNTEEELQQRSFFHEEEKSNPITQAFSEAKSDEVLGEFYGE